MKKDLKCAVCSGQLSFDDANSHYICNDCGATHETNLFKGEKVKTKRFKLKSLRLLIAILAALYLFYWWVRILYFRS